MEAITNKFVLPVKTLTGKTVEYEVSDDMSVEGLKFLIQKKEDIPLDQQRLVTYAGKFMQDRNTLSSYAITRGSCVWLYLRL
ncbi:ubiquitin-like protein [Serendipita vermifera]|nr:ubiquitin-like protein [Serendipita vermifera]